MKLKEFKALVASIPDTYDEYTVVQSKDEECNGFYEPREISFDSFNDGFSINWFDPFCDEVETYDAEFGNEEQFKETIESYKQLKPCIILW